MAWLQNLAGRAEDLLNKIDQNAATVLNDSNTKVDINDTDSSTFSITSSETSSAFSVNSVEIESEVLHSNATVIAPSTSNSPARSLAETESDTVPSQASPIVNILSERKKPSINGSLKDDSSSIEKTRSGSSTSSVQSSNYLLVEENQILNEKIARIEFENRDLSQEILNVHHLYLQLRNENSNLQNQIERLNEQIVNAQNEKDQYMARAQRVLQEKEELINLKEDTSDDNNAFANYIDMLKNELEFEQNKNTRLNEANKELKNYIQSLQMQHQIIQNGLQQTNQQLEENLLNERNLKRVVDEECQSKNREIHLKVSELSQLQDMINEKSNEIQQLRLSLQQKPHDDLESRIKSLTQTLMIKQNTLETITTERNALRLQMEKLETEYQTKLLHLKRNQVKIVNVPDTGDNVTSQVPQFMRVSPLDAGVTRRVKHAYSTVDAISVRTGIFLRRYPMARVIVFCYMVLLHIWVLFVLFLYAPSNR